MSQEWEREWRRTAGHVGALTCLYYSAQAHRGDATEAQALRDLNDAIEAALKLVRREEPPLSNE